MSDETDTSTAMPVPQAAPPADTSTAADMSARPAGQVPVQQAPDTSNLPAKTTPTAQQPSAQPAAPAGPKRSWFDLVLNKLASGSSAPRTVTKIDPTTGQAVTTPVPASSRVSLTGHILAGALSSMMEGWAAGQAAPDGPAGTRGPGNAAAFAGGYNAEARQQAAFRNAPQKQADEQQLRQYAATKNTLDELRNQQAIDRLHENDWSGKEDFYNKSQELYQPAIDSLEQTEKDTGEQLVAIGDRKMSHEDVMKRGDLIKLGLSPVQDGWDTRTAPNGQQYHVPTYSLVKSGNVNVNKAAITELAKTNSAVNQLLDDQGNLRTSGDSVPLNSTTFIGYEKQAHAANIAYEFIHQMQVGLGVDEKDQLSQNDFNSKFRDNPALQRQAVDAVTALGNVHTETTEHALSQLMKSGQAGEIAKLLGKSPDEVQAFLDNEENKHITAKATAANYGKPMTKDLALSIQSNPDESPARQAIATSFLNNLAKQGGAETQAKQDVKTTADQAKKDATNAPLVDQIGTGKIAPDKISYVLARNPELLAAVVAKYPDFDSTKATRYSDTYKDFTSGKTSVALNSGGTALKHLRDLKHINDANPADVHVYGTDAYNEYNNLLDTVAGELAQFYQLPKTDGQIKSMTSTLGAVTNRNAAILRQAKSMSEKLDSYEQEWKNAAPSKSYEAPMPKIDDDARAARAELVPKKNTKKPRKILRKILPHQPPKFRFLQITRLHLSSKETLWILLNRH